MVKPTKYRVTTLIMDLYPSAECTECAFTHGRSRSARQKAKWHTGETGHTTRVERITSTVFRGEERP